MTPKTAIRLFKFGANDTEKGTFYLSQADGKAVLQAFQARGTDLSWDYEHDVAQEGAQGPRPASAWSRLELRSDGLWATDIRWTKRALQLIDDEEYRYFSPYFEHTKDGHVTNIVNVALTNIPATHGIEPIAASARPGAKGRLGRGRLQEIPRDTTRRATNAKGRATALGRTIMTKEEMAKALAAINEQCKALGAALDDMGGGDDEKDKKKDELDEEQTDEETKKESASVIAALRALTGEKSPMKALSKALADRHPASDAHQDDDHAEQVEQAVKELKLQPSLRTWALGLSTASLRKFTGAANPVVKGRAGGGSRPSSTGGTSALSADEAEICRNLQISPEAFQKQKALLAGQPAGKAR